MDKKVLAAMQPYFTELFYNPSALYLESKSVALAVSQARKNIAGWLGVRSAEIVFTAGGTEANNLAIRGVMDAFPDASMLLSSIEHDSVTRPASQYKYQTVVVDREGVIDLKDLADKINSDTVLVSVMYANNEIGTIEPLAQIAAILVDVRKSRQKNGNKLPLYFHTDACQTANYLSLQAARLGVDMMTLNGGKIHGPKQSGLLYIGSHVQLEPLMLGGGQERGFRSGTENVASIMGLATALDIVQARRQSESTRLSGLQQLFLGLLVNKLPQIIVNGSLKSRLVNNVNISIPGEDNERLVMMLDEAGVQCASGSACSALSSETSRVLRAIGLDDPTARGSLRFTMGVATDEKAIRSTVETLAQIVA